MSGFLGDLSAAQETALGDLASNLVNLIPSLELPPEYQNLWGVPLAGIDEETRSDSQKRVLLKFLRAREFDVEAALKMAENALKWRHSFRINELMSEEFPPEFDALGMIYKTDKGGHPVTWNFYQNIDYAKVFHDGVDKFIRWRIQLMEKAVQLLDFEKGIETVTQIHSYEGVSMFSVDRNIRAASKEIITMFSDYYPEFLEKKIFAHVPWLMEILYSLFSSLTNARTRSKFQMTSSGNVKQVLDELLGDNIPPMYKETH